MARTLPHDCKPRQRCHNHAECAQCARIRQARIADRAEALLRDHLQLQLIVIKPEPGLTGDLIKAVQKCIRANKLRAGIWTIERGQKTGLIHANILTHTADLKTPKGWRLSTQPVRSDVRSVAAYISKPSQHPTREHYSGRTFGAFGHISEWLADGEQETVILAASAERALKPAAYVPAPPVPAPPAMPRQELSTDQYREIAERHLPMLRQIIGPFKRRIKETESG